MDANIHHSLQLEPVLHLPELRHDLHRVRLARRPVHIRVLSMSATC